jgi:prepilin-type N-terminal cleavage/methylation domain-containing protein
MRKVESGFTLIELIVAFSIMAVLSVVGIASFVTYSRTQAVDNEVNQLVAALNKAKAKAQSQVNPCTGQRTLIGYRVQLSTVSNTHQLQAVCRQSGLPDNYVSEALYTLPASVVIDSSTSPTVYSYNVLSSGFNSGTIVIRGTWAGTNIRRTISVAQNGKISITRQ